MRIFILSIILFSIFSCTSKKETPTTKLSKTTLTEQEILEGKQLLETHCYLCHNPKMPENEGRIAPPMVAIKAHYINMNDEGISKDDFIKEIVAYVENPTEEKAKLFGAVRKFGVMPKQQFPEKSVEKIAAYMYDYQIEEPEFFAAHFSEKLGKPFVQTGKKDTRTEKTKTTAEIGKDIALSTKEILGKNLMGSIQKKGTLAALEFCNIKAFPLTDSMALAKNATIKRVSDKNRNPKNKANTEELGYIETFKKQVANKQEPKPIIKENDTKVHFYYLIPTNTMCLQCHGKPENIKPEVLKKIKLLYPNDLATGYNENEVRGIWSITFDKK